MAILSAAVVALSALAALAVPGAVAHRHGTPLQRQTPVAGAVASDHVVGLSIEPRSLRLDGPRATARVIVTAKLSDGALLDVTDRCRFSAGSPASIRIGEPGVLRPVRDGESSVRARYGALVADASVRVHDAHGPVPVSFSLEVEPILTRAGCNQGACHGSQYGKGGFKLSLAGFDADLDYEHVARQMRGRRIDVAAPERSLLLRKPAMAVPHGGGRRLEPGTYDYRLIAEWLREGAHGPKPTDLTVDHIDVFPSERILRTGSAARPQRLVVVATYTDGSRRDVTPWARLNTLNDGVASCTPDGVVTASGPGQTAIMVRYGGTATVATMIVPYPSAAIVASRRGSAAVPPPGTPGVPPALPASATSLTANEPSARIDALVAAKQRQLDLFPSPICDDRTFVRRLFYDLIGTPPTPDEAAAFVADRSPDKRARLVDAVLARPEYADYWSLKWGDLLRCNRNALGTKGMWSFRNWIRGQFAANRPADQFIHDLIVARGSTYTNGPSNYYRVVTNPEDLAETTSQVFLGERLQCARCHHHPFERWSQKDYYEFAAFFARVGLKDSTDFGLFGREQVVRLNDGGEVTHPKTGAVMAPTPLGGASVSTADSASDRRVALADWLVSKRNSMFARNLANRYWGYLFGRGIVNPIDDERVTNPPTNPALLDFLAEQLVRDNYDLKRLIRAICLTQTYQRSSDATEQNRKDDLFFTHYLPKRLPAECLLDSVDFACGTHERFPGLPVGFRAIQLPDPGVDSGFLDVFGRPQRLIACECERVTEPNLSQTLRMMNGSLVNSKVTDYHGRVRALAESKKTDDQIEDELYAVTLCRPPRPLERAAIRKALVGAKDRKPVFEDVLITLLNSKEFLFNH